MPVGGQENPRPRQNVMFLSMLAQHATQARAAESLKNDTLHCKIVNSCFFSKNFSRPRAAALQIAAPAA
jgi:hypothetical protein